MAMLLGDVGGTNARMAIARNGSIDAGTVTRFKGDDFASFDDVVRQFMAEQHQPNISSMCIAVAGPVSGGRAQLTNRDWSFDEDNLARLTDADQVRLINDLSALGYSTPALAGEQLGTLRAAPVTRARNGQALVVGLGTGFNVCAVRVLPGGAITVLEAEEGHTHLPANIMARLQDRVGADAAAGFFSTEETFAGRGLSRLHAAMTGTAPIRSGLRIQVRTKWASSPLRSGYLGLWFMPGAFDHLVGNARPLQHGVRSGSRRNLRRTRACG